MSKHIYVIAACVQGIPQDYAEALKWCLKIAAQGEAAAQHNLGNMYVQGQGVPQDYGKAVEWYRKAAGQGRGQYNLGFVYWTG